MSTFDFQIVKNPEVFQQNRQKAHADHVVYRDRSEEAEGVSTFRCSLDGLWKFAYAKNPSLAPEDFYKNEVDCHDWDDIRVPAHIQMEGYGVPQYANTQYPWDGIDEVEPGEIPMSFNPTASYVKYFTLPESMKGERVFISFQGVESGFALWLNGRYVGYSENSFDPAEFELTDFLQEGENKLCARVFKWTSGSWTEDQDFFRFSGIYRSVYLYTIPQTHIRDLKVRTLLDDDYADAKLDLSLDMIGTGSVNICLEREGKTVLSKSAKLTEGENHIAYPVIAPAKWSAEAPNLYDLVLEVKDQSGKCTEFLRQKVGFRRFEIKDTVMLLNGKRIVFKGANRHDFSSKFGRAVTREEILKDVVTMKRNNINAIRTSHYPDVSYLYELCDIYGLYLIAENNMETHGLWDQIVCGRKEIEYSVPGDRMDWKPMMIDRVHSCYERDKNHPSVLIWSCGNESFGGKVIFDMSEEFRKLDPDRPVHYEGIFNDRRYDGSSDIESRMYPTVEDIKAYLAQHRNKPFICCEYTHAMGNSCGAMYKYTDLSDEEVLYQGGFIWDYVDQSIETRDRYGNEYQAYGGDLGDRPNDGNFSGNGIVYGGERDESPKMPSVKYNYQNIAVEVLAAGDWKLSVKITNKNLFTGTDAFNCVAILEREGQLIEKRYISTAVAPLSEETITLPFVLPENHSCRTREYTVTVAFTLKEDTLWAQAGHEVAFGQNSFKLEPLGTCSVTDPLLVNLDMALKGSRDRQANYLTETELTGSKLKVVHGGHNLGIHGTNFDVLFSYIHGGLVSYRYGGKELFDTIPRPNFWRPYTDNDRGNLMPQRYAQWKIASDSLTWKKLPENSKYPFQPLPEIVEEEDQVSITFTYFMPTTPASESKVTYTVTADGSVRTRLDYDVVPELGDMPEFGVMLRTPADLDTVTWYGLGLEETYSDRMQGAKMGVYTQRTNEAMGKYLSPQESGAKSEVRWAKVTDHKGRGLVFTGDNMTFSALPWSPDMIDAADHPYDLPAIHHTFIRCASAQMGIGGDDSWGAPTQEEFLLKAEGHMSFEFIFRGI